MTQHEQDPQCSTLLPVPSAQRNAELVKLQEEAAVRQEGERLRVEQQIQAERRAAEQYAVSDLPLLRGGRVGGMCPGHVAE